MWGDLYVIVTCGAFVGLIAVATGRAIDRWPEWRQRRDDFQTTRRMQDPPRINQVRRDPSPTPRRAR